LPEAAGLVLGERHRIISNDWQAAAMSTLPERLLDRAVELHDCIEFSPATLRSDLAGDRHTPRHLYSAVELIDHAADLEVSPR
jgi:hypothetical protein